MNEQPTTNNQQPTTNNGPTATINLITPSGVPVSIAFAPGDDHDTILSRASRAAKAADCLIKQGWSAPLLQAASPAIAPAAVADDIEITTATAIIKSYDEKKDEIMLKIRTPKYAKFGVRIWPEAQATMGIKPDGLKFGANALADAGVKPDAKFVILLGEKGPRKVLGLAQ